MNSKTMVVVEGAPDAAFVHGILGQQTPVKVANGASAAVSVARTLLIKGYRVALVLDGDAESAPELEERRRSVSFALGMAANESNWCLVLVNPSLEQFLVRSSRAVKAILKTNGSATERAPSKADEARRVLALNRADRRRRLATLPKNAANELIERDPQLQKLARFVTTDESSDGAVLASA